MLLPTLLRHAVTLLTQATPTVNKAKIKVLGASDPKVEMCLGPHCICNAVHHHEGALSMVIKVKWLKAVGFLSSWLRVARRRPGAQHYSVTISMFNAELLSQRRCWHEFSNLTVI